MNEKSHLNRLLYESSPYLRQHADNPVDWYPWCQEALDRAQKEDRPILLSIGYSTCHWCHVMELESFSRPEVARLMNRAFVCIKLDREERPDLDQIYMSAVTALTGSGGWPLNVFLTPDRQPFFGGTYFPPEKRPGIAAWPDILKAITDIWQDPGQRDRIYNSARQITQAIQRVATDAPAAATPPMQLIEKGLQALAGVFDAKHGGFGPAPKFPQPANQLFLLNCHFRQKKAGDHQGAEKTLQMALDTLDAMARGGIRDHIGGGFHRYATDANWHVPHFEKMLYDNAQLMENYIDAHLITANATYAQIAEETGDYILERLTDAEGGFFCAEDADSLLPDGGGGKAEGAYYTWRWASVEDLVGAENMAILAAYYGLQPDGNVRFDPHGELVQMNVPYQARSMESVARKVDRPLAEVAQIIASCRLQLRQSRNLRPAPHLDDKILTEWNGLAIGALARAHQALNQPRFLKAATRAARFIEANLYDPASRQLWRRWRRRKRGIAALASDYAALIRGLLHLYEAGFEAYWLTWAGQLTEQMVVLFYDPDQAIFYSAAKDQTEELIFRPFEDHDGAMPSTNAVAAECLFRLDRCLHMPKWREMAEKVVARATGRLARHPASSPRMLALMGIMADDPPQITVTGSLENAQTWDLLKAAQSGYYPGRDIIHRSAQQAEQQADPVMAALGLSQTASSPSASVCAGKRCMDTVADVAKLRALLDKTSLNTAV